MEPKTISAILSVLSLLITMIGVVMLIKNNAVHNLRMKILDYAVPGAASFRTCMNIYESMPSYNYMIWAIKWPTIKNYLTDEEIEFLESTKIKTVAA